MKLRQLSFLCVLFLSFQINAQQISNTGVKTKTDDQPQELKLSLGQSLTISPNPLPIAHPILNINTVNLEIFSYLIVSEIGAIVELENLAGKPDPSIIDLTGEVTVGAYIIRFDTSAGLVTRKFCVI